MLRTMGPDHFQRAPVWVRRVADVAGEHSVPSCLDALLESLAAELLALFPEVEFRTYRHQNNLFAEWHGGPEALVLSDALGVDTYDDGRGLRNALLWFAEDLPEPIDGSSVLLRRLT